MVHLLLKSNIYDANCQFDSKFGCNIEEANEIMEYAKLKKICICGISFHIGSGGDFDRDIAYKKASRLERGNALATRSAISTMRYNYQLPKDAELDDIFESSALIGQMFFITHRRYQEIESAPLPLGGGVFFGSGGFGSVAGQQECAVESAKLSRRAHVIQSACSVSPGEKSYHFDLLIFCREVTLVSGFLRLFCSGHRRRSGCEIG